MRDLNVYKTSYFENNDFEKTAVKYRRKKVLEIVKASGRKNILEIGCGMSTLAEDLEDFSNYTLVEPVEAFINKAKEDVKSHPKKSNIHFINLPIEKAQSHLPFRPDFIILSGLLHELENPEKMLQVIHEIADKDTMIHINVPNALSLHNRLATYMGLMKTAFDLSDTAKMFQRHQTYSLQTLSQQVENSGLQVLSTGSFFLKPFSNKQMRFIETTPDVFPTQLFDAFDSVIADFPELGSEIYVNVKKKA